MGYATQRYFDDVKVGDELTPVEKGPISPAHVMRWSASSENWHRIHYDYPFSTGHDLPIKNHKAVPYPFASLES